MKLLDLLAQLKKDYYDKGKKLRVEFVDISTGDRDCIIDNCWESKDFDLYDDFSNNFTILHNEKIIKLKNGEYYLTLFIDTKENIIEPAKPFELEIKEF